MSITFDCEYCGKKIHAPDTAGGKWGKCPGCHNKIFVKPPANTPAVEDDELRLAPIDENEELRQKRLLAESFKLRQNILSEKDIPEEQDAKKIARPAATDEKKLTDLIVTYLKYMVDGELEKAEKLARTITSAGQAAGEILDQIAYGEKVIPELENIPQQVLFGLIKELQANLG